MPIYRVAFAGNQIGTASPVWPRRIAAHDLGGVAEAVLSIAAEVLYDPHLAVRLDQDEDSDVATGVVRFGRFEVARVVVEQMSNTSMPVALMSRRELHQWKEAS